MAELHVSKKTIGKLFSEMQNKKFVIPDFQRPYKWNQEKCETLWNDIVNFTMTEARDGADYFLGTIVSSVNEDRNLDIIDGQQRITSFFLMLRAFYKKLEDMHEDDDVIGLKNQLAPCIWDINPISQKVSDRTKIHIESLVATEEDNDVFHHILETGEVSQENSDNYSKNYRFFKQQCDEYAEQHPMQWKELCITILQKCIILPIECESQETALTIFSTLNDRGMPLADSDIFKAQIYKARENPKDRTNFTNTWKELTSLCKNSGQTIDDIFRYYTHVLRARGNDKSKEIGLRRFYTGGNVERLREPSLIEDLMNLAKFWSYVNNRTDPEEEDQYTISVEGRQYIHCLERYPNEFWKYVTSVFFYRNWNSPTFEADFTVFLKKLVAYLFVKFIDKPSVNAIKDDIYSSCIGIFESNELKFKFEYNPDYIHQKLDEFGSSRISRGLLLLHAYLNEDQSEMISERFDIEHIFPKRWQDSNYNGWNKTDAEIYLDRFGNKIVLEKKLNIQAGNGYFGVKKVRYTQSRIAVVLELSQYHKDDWVKDDIEARESQFKSDILEFFTGQLVNP